GGLRPHAIVRGPALARRALGRRRLRPCVAAQPGRRARRAAARDPRRSAAKTRRRTRDRAMMPRAGAYAGGMRAMRVLAVAGVLGLALLLLGALADPRQAAFSYLMAYAYVLSLALGALLFLMIQRTIAATWSIVLHR